MVKPPAFLRILMMSVGGEEGTGAGVVAVVAVAGAVGAAAGDWAREMVKWEKSSIGRSGRVREKSGCFFIIITIFC